MKEKDALYAKPDFSDEDGIKAAELEGEFAELNGWEAESEASSLLQGLGIGTDAHYKLMSELTGAEKVKVLLAQALFGNPGILILDEPTNHLDIKSIKWLENFLGDFEGTVIVVSHDRHFLNEVCTHMADVDFGKIKLYVGNYDFWYETSQLATQMSKDQNKKKEEKIKEVRTTVASLRLDAVASSGFSVSRTKLVSAINAGLLQVNWQPAKGASQEVKEGDVISMRGRGRIKVEAITGTSRKGRIGVYLKRFM